MRGHGCVEQPLASLDALQVNGSINEVGPRHANANAILHVCFLHYTSESLYVALRPLQIPRTLFTGHVRIFVGAHLQHLPSCFRPLQLCSFNCVAKQVIILPECPLQDAWAVCRRVLHASTQLICVYQLKKFMRATQHHSRFESRLVRFRMNARGGLSQVSGIKTVLTEI